MRCATMLSLPAAPLIALCVCDAAWAGSPPLSIDDTETPGAGGWEFNITSSIERTVDGTEVEAPLFDFNHGFFDNDQLKVEFALLSNDPSDEGNHWGVSDLSIGYKYRFFEDGPSGLQISSYPQLSLPTGDDKKGLGSGHTELLIPFELQLDLGEGGWLNPEIGYTVVFGHHKENSIKYGLAAGWEVFDGFEAMAEVAGLAFPRGPEPDDVYFDVGFGYILNRNVRLLGSIGRSFYQRHHGTPTLTALFGFQLLFGPIAAEEGEAVALRARALRPRHHL